MMKKSDIPTIVFLVIVISAVIMLLIFLEPAFNVVNEYPIDTRYTESQQGIETTYKYIYDIFSDEGFKKVPDTHTTIYPEKYEVLYVVEYETGRTAEEWREVTKQEYEAVLNQIKEEVNKDNE